MLSNHKEHLSSFYQVYISKDKVCVCILCGKIISEEDCLELLEKEYSNKMDDLKKDFALRIKELSIWFLDNKRRFI